MDGDSSHYRDFSRRYGGWKVNLIQKNSETEVPEPNEINRIVSEYFNLQPSLVTVCATSGDLMEMKKSGDNPTIITGLAFLKKPAHSEQEARPVVQEKRVEPSNLSGGQTQTNESVQVKFAESIANRLSPSMNRATVEMSNTKFTTPQIESSTNLSHFDTTIGAVAEYNRDDSKIRILPPYMTQHKSYVDAVQKGDMGAAAAPLNLMTQATAHELGHAAIDQALEKKNLVPSLDRLRGTNEYKMLDEAGAEALGTYALRVDLGLASDSRAVAADMLSRISRETDYSIEAETAKLKDINEMLAWHGYSPEALKHANSMLQESAIGLLGTNMLYYHPQLNLARSMLVNSDSSVPEHVRRLFADPEGLGKSLQTTVEGISRYGTSDDAQIRANVTESIRKAIGSDERMQEPEVRELIEVQTGLTLQIKASQRMLQEADQLIRTIYEDEISARRA